ncbi:MAG: hypothetical protein U9Q33_04425, partial [Campylobacterota bacterium]|nr:hypothetical protein [Campylobacterota bacterium]
NDYILEFNYEYNKLFRDKKLEYMNKNNIINMFLSKKISDNVLVYLGGRAMFQQFNTDIPYLYNQYSQTQFDKKYGFAQLGLIYSF